LPVRRTTTNGFQIVVVLLEDEEKCFFGLLFFVEIARAVAFISLENIFTMPEIGLKSLPVKSRMRLV
jgi:hypothetical protein